MLVMVILLAFSSALSAQIKSSWCGCDRYDYQIDGRAAIMVVPETPAPGKPWIWRPAFFDAFPSVDKALLAEGWHVAYYDVTHCYGTPQSVEWAKDFYDDALERFGVNPKATVEGFSRGGYFSFAWAATYPQTVASIYVDAPVCDITSWPGRKDKVLWEDFLNNWGLDDSEVDDSFKGNALQHLKPIAKARIPIISVCGGSDTAVPFEENFKKVKEAYEQMGGTVELILKPDCGHHPHSLEDPRPVVDFLKRYAPQSMGRRNVHGRKTKGTAWRVTELSFTSDTDYSKGGGDAVELDVEFVNSRSGQTLIRPAFWDGGSTFIVRFAPTGKGRWTWSTTCPQDRSLSGQKGKLVCKQYGGALDIYRHGFLKAEPGKKYLTYADGTPFFYLGDTHWGMYKEELDEPGPNAGSTGAESHFKYIVDRRVGQGFTVYQSEPIDAKFNVRDGKVDESDIEGFREADRYYQYIADAGLVHANAELFFSGEMTASLMADHAALERLGRYWVARFGAYPVVWTMAQEVDNDSYFERQDQALYDSRSNPWVTLAEFVHKYDCYSHPLSAHQENAWFTTVTGAGTLKNVNASDGGASAFLKEEVAARTGHNWWAVQWSPSLDASPNQEVIRDYWNSSRPAVNYEGRYCCLWTKDFGSRAQGWISFLSGFCGYGYGAIDMWLYKSAYDTNTVSFDGVDSISVADKARPWSEALEFESARQMLYLKDFLQSFDWWDLTPVFDEDKAFEPSGNPSYSFARTGKRNVLYFYGKGTETGCLTGLTTEDRFEMKWFNPRTGEYSESSDLTSEGGRAVLPSKPDAQDWVLVLDKD